MVFAKLVVTFTISDAVLANNPGVILILAGNGTLTTGEDSTARCCINVYCY